MIETKKIKLGSIIVLEQKNQINEEEMEKVVEQFCAASAGEINFVMMPDGMNITVLEFENV